MGIHIPSNSSHCFVTYIVFNDECDAFIIMDTILFSMQELNAASRAVLSVFPGAQIANKCKNSPMIVSIDAEVEGEDDLVHVWDGDQKGLYSKYGHRAVPLIKQALLNFKQTAMADEGAGEEEVEDEK